MPPWPAGPGSCPPRFTRTRPCRRGHTVQRGAPRPAASRTCRGLRAVGPFLCPEAARVADAGGLGAPSVLGSSPRSKRRATSSSAPSLAPRMCSGLSGSPGVTGKSPEARDRPEPGARRCHQGENQGSWDGDCRTDADRCFCFLPFFVKAKIPSDFSWLAKTDTDVGLWEKRGCTKQTF